MTLKTQHLTIAVSALLAVCSLISLKFAVHKSFAGSASVAGSMHSGPTVGAAAPAFTLPDPSGQPHSLASFPGPTTVGFFCGCDRCQAAAHKIAQLQRAGQLRYFVAIVPFDPAGARHFQRKTGLAGTVLMDSTEATATKYESEYCPRLWKIAADGRITYRSGVALEGADLSQALQALTAPER